MNLPVVCTQTSDYHCSQPGTTHCLSILCMFSLRRINIKCIIMSFCEVRGVFSVLPRYLIFSVHATFRIPYFKKRIYSTYITRYSLFNFRKALLIRYKQVPHGFHATCIKLYLKTQQKGTKRT